MKCIVIYKSPTFSHHYTYQANWQAH